MGTAPPPIPADQSELTPGWLTQVLRRAGAIKAGRVAGVSVEPAGQGQIAELEAALEGAGFFTDDHAALLAAMLARIDRVNAEIARLTEVIDRLLAPRKSSCSRPSRCPAGAAAPPRTPSPRPAWI